MPTQTDIAVLLADAAARLQACYPYPTTLDDTTRAVADNAVDGIVWIYYNGAHRLAIGRTAINWRDASFPPGTASFLYRMQFIDALARAYHVTKDERYAEAAHDYLASYMAAWPHAHLGEDRNADNVMEIGIRNTIWARSLGMLAASPAFDAVTLAWIVDYSRVQYQYVHDHLSTTINWRVHNAHDLIRGGLYLAFLEQAPGWRQLAVRALNDAWFRQFLPDGVHIERNPIYHGGMAGTFRDLYRLGCVLPELGLCMTLDRLIPMYDFTLACTKPNGYLCGLHDSQSEFTGHLRDGKHTDGHKGVDNTAAWEYFRREFSLPLDRPATSQVFSDAGLAFLRTAWEEDAAWMSFDATNWGGGHCHLGRNAVQLHAFRQSMVIDPGWLDYETNEWATYGRATRAHSTCNLNGLSQSSTKPSGFRHYGAPGYDAIFSVYEGGYWDTQLKWTFTHAGQGIWAEHARTLFWVQDRFAFIADSMFRLPNYPGDPAAERPSFECVWQLAPEAAVTVQPERNRAVAQWTEAGLLLLTPIRPEGSQYEVHEGETSPLRGWTPGELTYHPAPQVVLNTPVMHRQHDYYVTVMMPYQGQQAPEVEVTAQSPNGTLGYVHLKWADGSEDLVHWGCNFGLMLGAQADFDTDSSQVHLRKNAAGRVIGGCCVNGTYIAPFDTTPRQRPETFTFTA